MEYNKMELQLIAVQCCEDIIGETAVVIVVVVVVVKLDESVGEREVDSKENITTH